MKEIKIKGIIPCPRCGGGVILRRNAAKLFQISCTKCEARTGWKRKPDAIIAWYNMVIQYLRNTGELQEGAQS